MINLEVDDDGEKVKWLKMRSIAINKDDPDAFIIKYEHEGQPHRLDTKRRVRKSRKNGQGLLAHPIPLMGVRGISAVKKKDLLQLCRDTLIPNVYHEFFNGIPVSADANAEDQQDHDVEVEI